MPEQSNQKLQSIPAKNINDIEINVSIEPLKDPVTRGDLKLSLLPILTPLQNQSPMPESVEFFYTQEIILRENSEE
jgi:hypothetical protein